MTVLCRRAPWGSAKTIVQAEGSDSQSGPFPKYSAAFDCFPCGCSQYLERVIHTMSRRTLLYCVFFRISILALSCFVYFVATSMAQVHDAKKTVPDSSVPADVDHEQERSAWFLRGRVIPGKNSAELRRRAYMAKMQKRGVRIATARTLPRGTAGSVLPAISASPSPAAVPSDAWQPLGPVPLASDASGNGTQDYHQA